MPVRMRRDTGDLHSPGRQIEDKENVVPDQPAQRKNLDREESVAVILSQCALRKVDYEVCFPR